MNYKRIMPAALCLMSIFFSIPICADDAQNKKITVNGETRTYLLHVPDKVKDEKNIPVVIVLHGAGGNANNIAENTGFIKKADSEGFIVAFPNGSGRQNRMQTWNAGSCCGFAKNNNIDDVAYMKTLIDELIKKYKADPKRIYVTGISNGGMMSHRLACELSDKIAAIAPVAGSLVCDCIPKYPISVLIIHGTEDMAVPYEGSPSNRNVVFKSVNQAVDFWVKHNGCASLPKYEKINNVEIYTYAKGKQNTEVKLMKIIGGGHSWPGGKSNRASDKSTHAIKATDEIWNFFKSHTK